MRRHRPARCGAAGCCIAQASTCRPARLCCVWRLAVSLILPPCSCCRWIAASSISLSRCKTCMAQPRYGHSEGLGSGGDCLECGRAHFYAAGRSCQGKIPPRHLHWVFSVMVRLCPAAACVAQRCSAVLCTLRQPGCTPSWAVYRSSQPHSFGWPAHPMPCCSAVGKRMDSKDATTRLTDVTANANRGDYRLQVGALPDVYFCFWV